MKKTIVYIFLAMIAITSIAFIIVYKNNKKYDLSIVAIMKNEKPYLKEWIEYHRMQGVEHFYLCDNASTDGSKEYLTPYIDNNIITYIYLPGINQQKVCYQQVVEKYKNETKWLAIIDLDEYLVPIKVNNMLEFLEEFDYASEVSLHWLIYGDNNAVSRQQGLLTEFFTSHGKQLNHTVKSIVRPNKVINFDAFGSNHYVRVEGKSVNEYHKPVTYMLNFNISADKARVNHYITKTYAEFLQKKLRGHPEGTSIDYRYYFYHNENDITNDTTMQRFLPELKKRMKKSLLKDVPITVSSNYPKTFDDIYYTREQASEILGYDVKKQMSHSQINDLYHNRHPRY